MDIFSLILASFLSNSMLTETIHILQRTANLTKKSILDMAVPAIYPVHRIRRCPEQSIYSHATEYYNSHVETIRTRT